MERSVGIVIPAYRPDVATLRPYVQAIADEIDPASIVIELDDPTGEVGPALDDLPATVSTTPRRRGKGAAVTHGFERLDTDVFAFADADGSVPTRSVDAVIAPVRAGELDLSVGSRRHPAATVIAHQTYARRWLGNAFAWLARRLLTVDLSDYQCGAKAIDRGGWRRLRSHLYEPGFGWDVELIAMAGACDLRIGEVPVVWRDEPGSTVSPIATPIDLGRALLVARRRAAAIRSNPASGPGGPPRTDRLPLVDRPAGNDE